MVGRGMCAAQVACSACLREVDERLKQLSLDSTGIAGTRVVCIGRRHMEVHVQLGQQLLVAPWMPHSENKYLKILRKNDSTCTVHACCPQWRASR